MTFTDDYTAVKARVEGLLVEVAAAEADIYKFPAAASAGATLMRELIALAERAPNEELSKDVANTYRRLSVAILEGP